MCLLTFIHFANSFVLYLHFVRLKNATLALKRDCTIEFTAQRLSNHRRDRRGVCRKMLGYEKETANVIHYLDRLLLGSPNYRQQYMKEVQNVLIRGNVEKLEFLDDYGAKFTRRITAICWHPKYPRTYAVGSKFGDITVGKLVWSSDDSGVVSMQLKAEIEGSGAGGSITAMQFDQNEMNVIYRASIDSKVSRIDLSNESNSLVYFDYDSYTEWFTSMDICYESNILASGDNKGNMLLFNLRDGRSRGTHKLHTTKIHDVQFNKKDPNIFVTASTTEAKGERSVKIWDMRKINFKEPLFTLPHNCGVNVARFNPVDSSKLLTSDQQDEIRIYQGPLWKDPLIISHSHPQFQHLTPVKADWHPLSDMIVIGSYPKNQNPGRSSKNAPQRFVEFYEATSGKKVCEIIPPLNEIVSLNVFNPTGEFLASGMNSKLVLWRPSFKLEELGTEAVKSEQPSQSLSNTLREQLRGRPTTAMRKPQRKQTREFSPTSDDENSKKVPSKRSKKASSTTTTVSSNSKTQTSKNEPTTRLTRQGKGKK